VKEHDPVTRDLISNRVPVRITLGTNQIRLPHSRPPGIAPVGTLGEKAPVGMLDGLFTNEIGRDRGVWITKRDLDLLASWLDSLHVEGLDFAQILDVFPIAGGRGERVAGICVDSMSHFGFSFG